LRNSAEIGQAKYRVMNIQKWFDYITNYKRLVLILKL